MGLQTDIRRLLCKTNIDEFEGSRSAKDTPEARREAMLFLDLAVDAGYPADDRWKEARSALGLSTYRVDMEKCAAYLKEVQARLQSEA